MRDRYNDRKETLKTINPERVKGLTKDKTITFINIGVYDTNEQDKIIEMLRIDFYGTILINQINSKTSEIIVYNNTEGEKTLLNTPYKFLFSKVSEIQKNILMQGIVKYLRMTILYRKKEIKEEFELNFNMFPLDTWSTAGAQDILFKGNNKMRPNTYRKEFPKYWHTYPYFMSAEQKAKTILDYWNRRLDTDNEKFAKVQLFKLSNIFGLDYKTMAELNKIATYVLLDKETSEEQKKDPIFLAEMRTNMFAIGDRVKLILEAKKNESFENDLER